MERGACTVPRRVRKARALGADGSGWRWTRPIGCRAALNATGMIVLGLLNARLIRRFPVRSLATTPLVAGACVAVSAEPIGEQPARRARPDRLRAGVACRVIGRPCHAGPSP